MLVYLDNCCFNRPFDDQSSLRIALESQAKLYIQAMIVRGDIQLATSYMSIYENGQNPFEDRRNATTNFVNTYSAIHISAEMASTIQRKAESIMRTGVKTKDAYHLACAFEAECTHFISTDDRLLKYKTPKLLLMNPVDFIRFEV